MSLLSHLTFKGRQELAAAADNPAIAVTAGAGSGKTRTLTGRYLHLLEQGHPLRAIIAITFTEKAAREMRTRIRSEIEKWADTLSHPRPVSWGESGDASPSQGEAMGVRERIDSARIGTIHSLCAEILRAHPAEAGIDPAFTVIEDGLAAALRAEAVDAALAWAASDLEAAMLFAHFKENELRRLLTDLLNRRLDLQPWLEQTTDDRHFGYAQCRRPATDDWRLALTHWLDEQFAAPAWQDSLADLARSQSSNPDDKLEIARREVLARWDEARAQITAARWDSAFLALAALRKVISATGGSKTNWDAADLDAARAAMRALSGHYDAQIKPLVNKSRWALDIQAAALLPALTLLVEQTLDGYERRKDEQQALDFDDLEGRAARLLAEHPAVRARWQNEIHAVLVDEFQDTNDRQRQIVYTLSQFQPPSARNPLSPVPYPLKNDQGIGDRGDNPPSSLFIVGDAKQSIYKFRGADVTVFRQVQADIRAAGGLPVDLDLTFRAHKPLLDLLNSLLASILGAADDPAHPYQVPFAPLQADRQTPKIAQPPFVECHIGIGEDADEGRASAASALAGRLYELRNEGFGWGDMALLFRASTGFAAYEDALERAGIPFVTIAGRGFYNRPEIRDLLNALAAIADPTDDLALAGLLRSPALALPDDDLYHLRFPSPLGGRAGGDGLWLALQTSPSPFHRRAAAIITELHALSGRAPAAEALKRFLDLTGYRAILSAAPGGSRMTRNVDKLLADAHRSQLVGLGEFLEYVQTLRDVGLREGEAPVDPSAGPGSGAVQLMTVHKSKGLEFPLVVIADAAYEPRPPAAGALLDSELGLLPGLKDDDDNRPAAWRLAYLREAAKDDAEDRRLLYVAATRAREKLLVSGYGKLLRSGKLGLRGWLADFGKVLGMDEVAVEGDLMGVRELAASLPSGGDPIPWVMYPPAVPVGLLPLEAAQPPESEASPVDLVAPLPPPSPEKLDERTRSRETDPPDRVWRVVPKAKKPSGPAWVVGKLVHEALRRWRFPADDDFLRPYALEAGLADEAEIRATLGAARRLLERFHAHPLCAEVAAAERYHELPFVLAESRGVIDLLYRASEGWVIVDFKTDETRSEAEAREIIAREGYDAQVRRYMEAAAPWLGARPRGRLVFLQMSGGIGVFEVE